MENDKKINYALVGLSAIAVGGFLYWLTKKQASKKQAPKNKAVKQDLPRMETCELDSRFTKEKLRVLMEELQQENTCIYVRNYNLMLRLKSKGKNGPNFINQLRQLVDKELADKLVQVVEAFCLGCHPNAHDQSDTSHQKDSISNAQFSAWLRKCKNEPFVAQGAKYDDELRDDLFERQCIKPIPFAGDMPQDLSAEKYIEMYKKIWAIIRHDIWQGVEDRKKELGTTNLSEQEFDKVYWSVSTTFDLVRLHVYEKTMGANVTSQQARQFMQKAYVIHATQPFVTEAAEGQTETPRSFADTVDSVAMEHNRYVGDFFQGKFYPGIDNDPRV